MSSLLRYRRPLIVVLHVLLVVLAQYLAFCLRFDGDIPQDEWAQMVQALPWLVIIRGLIFVPFGLYQGLWRYSSIWDLSNIILGVFTSTILFYWVVTWELALRN